MAEKQDPFAGVQWHDAIQLGLEGLGWSDLEPGFPASRLPLRAKPDVSEDLWRLSRNGNGVSFRFRSNAETLFARWSLGNPVPEISISGGGLDCYGRDAFGDWRWVGRTTPWKQPDSDGSFNQTPLDGEEREYKVYLPIAAPVTQLQIGVNSGATFEPLPPRPVAEGKGIVYYGTSIVYGAGVSRPGMSHANQLGRWLDQPMVNLGFAGRAWMEPEVAALVAELDPALFILDPLPNLKPEMIRERMAPFFRILREARPETPILWVGERILTDSAFQPKRRAHYEANLAAAREVFASLQSEGLTGIHQVEGGEMFGTDNEGAGDGSHPNDLGAIRMARLLLPPIARLLGQPATA